MTDQRTYTMHVSQMINREMEMNADGDKGTIIINVKLSKSDKYYIATKATEYWVEETATETLEGEDAVDLTDAIQSLVHCVPADMDNVDGQFSAYTEEHGLKPLVWFTCEKGNRTGQTMSIINK